MGKNDEKSRKDSRKDSTKGSSRESHRDEPRDDTRRGPEDSGRSERTTHDDNYERETRDMYGEDPSDERGGYDHDIENPSRDIYEPIHEGYSVLNEHFLLGSVVSPEPEPTASRKSTQEGSQTSSGGRTPLHISEWSPLPEHLSLLRPYFDQPTTNFVAPIFGGPRPGQTLMQAGLIPTYQETATGFGGVPIPQGTQPVSNLALMHPGIASVTQNHLAPPFSSLLRRPSEGPIPGSLSPRGSGNSRGEDETSALPDPPTLGVNLGGQFPAGAQDYWPRWITRQFHEFRGLIHALALLRDSEEAIPDSQRTTAERLIHALLDSGGVAFHLESRFPIGGPGAHPEDIVDLFSDAGWHIRTNVHKNTAEWLQKKYLIDQYPHLHNILKVAQGYVRFLRADRPSPLLGATSGSARVRAESRGVRMHFRDIDRPTPDQLFIPRNWTYPFLTTIDSINNMITLLGLPHRSETSPPAYLTDVIRQAGIYMGFEFFENNTITAADAEGIIREGGIPRSRLRPPEAPMTHYQGYGWTSMAEILQNMAHEHPYALDLVLHGTVDTTQWRWWDMTGPQTNSDGQINWARGAWRFVENGGQGAGVYGGSLAQLNPQLRTPPTAADDNGRKVERLRAAHREWHRNSQRRRVGDNIAAVTKGRPDSGPSDPSSTGPGPRDQQLRKDSKGKDKEKDSTK